MSVYFDIVDMDDLCASIAGNEMVVASETILDPASEIVVLYTYPLGNPAKFTESAEGGFTKGKFLAAIRARYREIYEEERRTSTIKEGRASEMLLNRNSTNGTYGIACHDIGDLYLEEAYKEDGVWHLVVGS